MTRGKLKISVLCKYVHMVNMYICVYIMLSINNKKNFQKKPIERYK